MTHESTYNFKKKMLSSYLSLEPTDHISLIKDEKQFVKTIPCGRPVTLTCSRSRYNEYQWLSIQWRLKI